ncbi:MAG: hypothetical protein GY701_21670 [Sulfitobacter sp.]|nr:hypothetical protein [Sulfitobacter sp.]
MYLNCNRLTSLPNDIGKLRGLSLLFLYKNWLKTLPRSIGNMIDLRELFSLLKSLDKNRTWGGLKRVLTPSGEYL